MFVLSSFTTSFAQFTERHADYGVNMVTTGGSVFGHALSVCDFDGDGLDDISFGTTDQSPRFYRNTGSGFELVSFGFSSPSNSIKALLWADIDNDGDQDLFISYEYNTVRLYENTGNMVMVDITADSGLLMETNIRNAGASFGDYNNDGFLDLYLCKYYNPNPFTGVQYENKLYRNNGDLTFTDVTEEANASVGSNPSFIASWFDYNHDGWQDIFIANDRLLFQNHLLRNNGDGTFTEVSAEVGMNNFMDSMGIGFGDFNNDLLLDVFVPNTQNLGNHLYKQLPNQQFENVGVAAGVESTDLCWAGLWMDYDNNGWLDLHVATEFYFIGQNPSNLFYVNNEDETFTESAEQVGLEYDNFSTLTTAQGDWNMDGYPDFISHNTFPNPSLLWENNGGNNQYLAVTLTGVISNRDAVGSTLYCYAGGDAQMRYTACGEAYLAQNSRRQIFGLGETEVVDSLVIEWLSGQVDRYYHLQADSTYHFIEGGGQNGYISSSSNHFCNGDSLLLVASGGSNIVWSNGTNNVDSLWVYEPGTFTYEAESALGLTFTSVPFTVQSSDFSYLDLQITQPLCAGDSNGGYTLIGAEAIANSSLFLNDLPVGWAASDLTAGDYELTLVSDLGCEEHFNFTLLDNSIIEANLSVTPILCFGGTGEASVEPVGGTGELSVGWSSTTVDELPEGTYSVLITDENGCTLEVQFELQEPEPLVISSSVTDVAMENGGSIQLLIDGGTPPYNIMWMGPNGFTSQSEELYDLQSGIYTALITDSFGCIASYAATILPLGREERNKRMPVIAYPNPFVNELHIDELPAGMKQIELFSIEGRLVWAMTTDAESVLHITLSELYGGYYILVVTSTESTQRLKLTKTY